MRDFEIFLPGYSSGRPPDDECGQLAGDFTRWVATHYRVHDGPRNGFRLILEHVDMRDDLAFEEFFRLWPSYQRERVEYGSEGISARYMDAMQQLLSKPSDI